MKKFFLTWRFELKFFKFYKLYMNILSIFRYIPIQHPAQLRLSFPLWSVRTATWSTSRITGIIFQTQHLGLYCSSMSYYHPDGVDERLRRGSTQWEGGDETGDLVAPSRTTPLAVIVLTFPIYFFHTIFY